MDPIMPIGQVGLAESEPVVDDHLKELVESLNVNVNDVESK